MSNPNIQTLQGYFVVDSMGKPYLVKAMSFKLEVESSSTHNLVHYVCSYCLLVGPGI